MSPHITSNRMIEGDIMAQITHIRPIPETQVHE